MRDYKIVNDHFEIYEAICRSDADGAEELMQKHLSRFRIDEELIREKYPDYFL